MRENEERGLFISEKIRNIAYNTKYKMMKYFEQYKPDSFAKPNQCIFILGNKFQVTEQNLQEVQAQIYAKFQSTPWLTYRSGFPQLRNHFAESLVSDTGWGCMVRVGQMLFAQVIKQHQRIKEKKQIIEVLNLFNDFDYNQPFSIHRIAKLAKIEYKLKAGQWYNPSQISYILSCLYNEYLSQKKRMKFMVFNSGNLFFDNICQQMVGLESNCSCKKASQDFICEICNSAQYSITTIVLNRLGLHGPQQKYLKVLGRLMELPSNQGIIGGKPERALYFVGKQEDHLIYLDPHYVQQAEKDIKSKEQTYFCPSFRMCRNSSIDSSVGFCFYLRDVKELNLFYKQIKQIKKENPEDFFIFSADKTPSYIKKVVLKSETVSNQSDEFEVI